MTTRIVYSHYEKYSDEADKERARGLLLKWRESLNLEDPYENHWDEFLMKKENYLYLSVRPVW